MVIGQLGNSKPEAQRSLFGFKLPDYTISKPVLDLAHQLQRLYLAGFELQTFDRFPKCVGVIRENCIAMLVPGTDGFQILGTPGWHMGEAIGVLVEKDERQVFQHKQEIVVATPERLQSLSKFKEDLNTLLKHSRDDA